MYAVILLFCVTLSQKVPNIPQNWPLLYVGIVLIFIWTCYILTKIFIRKRLAISGVWASLLYFVLVFFIFLDVVINPQSRNAFVLNIILIHFFPIILVKIFIDKSVNFMLYTTAKIICIFSVLQAFIAWLFIAGWSFPLLGVDYQHNLIWGARLHGLMGEPTHFGLLLGIGLISLLYLYDRRQALSSISRPENMFFLLLSLFFIASIQFSGTRNALVATTLSLLVYAVFDRRVRNLLKKYILAFIPLALLFIVIFADVLIIYLDILLAALRFGDSTSESVRLLAIYNNLLMMSEFSFGELFFGVGYSESLVLTTSFNQYIDILRNFGVTWLLISILLVFMVFYAYVKKIRGGWSEGVYPFSLLIYCLSVFMFYSPMNAVFHIVAFVFVWSIFVCFTVQKKLVLNLDLVRPF
ncbi:hypothetical protein N8254_03385 [Pseudomonadales bacterium]|nr:hypothetical protein [Pseudomonadales bacterium]